MKRPRGHEDSDHSDSTEVQGASVADLYVMGLYQSGHSIKQPDCTAALTLINLSLSRPGPSAAELHDWFEEYDQGSSQQLDAETEAEDDHEADIPTPATPTSATAQSRLRQPSPMKQHLRHSPAAAVHSRSTTAAAPATSDDEHPAGWVQACLQCGSTDTPLWRTGPGGPKTLCNACGVKFSRHQHKGKPGLKHHAAKKVKLSGTSQPGSDSGSPLA